LLCEMIMDTLGFEPRAFRTGNGCDTTTPSAQSQFSKLQLEALALRRGHT
jgi:hypothetical protein